MKSLSKDWKQTTVIEMLGAEHFKNFIRIWGQNQGGIDQIQKDFLEYLKPFREEFKTRGLHIEYMAHAVLYAVLASQQKQTEDRMKVNLELTETIMQAGRG